MKIKLQNFRKGITRSAFTLIEVITSVAMVSVVFLSLYAGITMGFAITQVARENLRATQILVERMEGIRLYSWTQLNTPNMIPSNFTSYYYPLATGSESKGVEYSGTYELLNAPMTATYSSGMKEIKITITWNSGNILRTRSMSTYVGQYGLQNYIFTN